MERHMSGVVRVIRGAGEQGEEIMRGLVIGAAALVTCTGAAVAQDIEAGERSFRKCSSCHAVGEGARSLIGPALNGLDGRKAGSVEGYSYTDANKSAGIVWSEATFKDYIQDPQAKIPGTKMFFAGIKNEQEIADLWAFLKQFGPDGKKK
jgi:cytochrome c